MSTKTWVPPSSLEEKIKHNLFPPKFFIWRLAKKEWRKGEGELHILPFLVDKTRNAIDIGTCWGVYTYYLSKLCPHVYSFEPNPKIYPVMKATTGKNVTTYPYALSNQTGEAVLRVPKGRKGFSNQGASLSAVKVDGEHGESHITAKRLDDMQLTNIGFIKIDVEGFEKEVLEGAIETIKRDRPTLLIEIEEKHTKLPIEDSLAQVEALGYHTFILLKNRLLPRDYFDPEKNHRNPSSGKDYIFNFIFIPQK